METKVSKAERGKEAGSVGLDAVQEGWGIQDKSVEEDEINSLSLGGRRSPQWQQSGGRWSSSDLNTGHKMWKDSLGLVKAPHTRRRRKGMPVAYWRKGHRDTAPGLLPKAGCELSCGRVAISFPEMHPCFCPQDVKNA